jgi:glutamyl-Q tRNA(Asp) synthetase
MDGAVWPRDPDGAPRYPGDAAVLSEQERQDRAQSDAPFALRLNMQAALEKIGRELTWQEYGAEGQALFDPPREIAVDATAWGDVILARKDTPTSYHLSVVVDDARQGITDVLRGQDLYAATSVHRVLQVLLDLPEPRYRHHRLILGGDGRKLSKSSQDTSLRALREAGISHAELRKRIGL